MTNAVKRWMTSAMEGLSRLLIASLHSLLNEVRRKCLTPQNVPKFGIFSLSFFSLLCTECVIWEPPWRSTAQAVSVPVASSEQEITQASVCLSARVSTSHTKEGRHTGALTFYKLRRQLDR